MTEFHQTLGAFDRQFTDDRVVLCRAVEGRGDDLTFDRPLHVGDFFWSLVDEHDHQVNLGVVLSDGVRDGLEHHRLTGFRRRHDETALPFTNRGDEIDNACRQILRCRLQPQPVLRIQRGQLREVGPVFGRLQVSPIDGFHTHQRVELLSPFTVARLTHLTGDCISLAQVVLAHQRQRDVHVVGARKVATGADEGVVVQNVDDARHRQQNIVLSDDRLAVAVATLAVATVSIPVPTPTAATTAIVSVVAVISVVAVVTVISVVAVVSVAAVVARRPFGGFRRAPSIGLRGLVCGVL